MAARTLRTRLGFTLVELLVVIAIIGVLVALLLPAIQAAREAARRAECQNKLKQMGLGVQNFVGAKNVFPTGGDGANPDLKLYVKNGKANGPNEQGLGWGFQILPYLEQNAVYGLTTTAQVKSTTVTLYNCPSRRSSIAVQQEGPGTTLGPTVVLSDYAGATPCTCKTADCTAKFNPSDSVPLSGRNVARDLTTSNAYSFFFGKYQPGEQPENVTYDGVIVRTPWRIATSGMPARFAKNVPYAVKLGQIVDGLSNTILIGEKYVHPDWYGGGIFVYSDDRGWTDGWDPDQMRSTCFQPMPDNDPQGNNTTLVSSTIDVWYFGSAHTGVWNSVYADGSVHAMRYDVDVVLFNSLGTRNGEESIDLSQL